MYLICAFHDNLLSLLSLRTFVCVEKGIVTVYIYQTFVCSKGSLSRVEKHGNCFVCIKLVRIELFSYCRDFFINRICYLFGIKIL